MPEALKTPISETNREMGVENKITGGVVEIGNFFIWQQIHRQCHNKNRCSSMAFSGFEVMLADQ